MLPIRKLTPVVGRALQGASAHGELKVNHTSLWQHPIEVGVGLPREELI